MSDIKISQLPQSTQLTGSEIVPMDQVQGGNLVTVKATTQDIANLSSLGYTAENVANKSTDGTFNANSDILYPSQKATKTYVDAVAVGLLKDNGNYDPTITNQYPTSDNTLSGGNPQKGDIWYISADGDMNGNAVLVGYSVRALVNNPGDTTDANWAISNVGLGFIPENVDNKSTDVNLGTSDTLYPTQNAVKTYVDGVAGVPTLQEVLNNNHELTDNNNLQGTYAGGGESFSGAQVNAFGYEAAYDNVESNINALGSYAAKGNTGADVNALGYQAAEGNVGNNVNAFGSYAAFSNAEGEISINNINALGYNSANGNTGSNVNALGANAGLNNTFSNVNLLGASTQANGNYQTVLSAPSSKNARIDTSSLTDDVKYILPNKTEDQTFAMLSDITNSGGWSLTGNAGTDDTTNFIGTTDEQDLVFKVNNNEVARLDTYNTLNVNGFLNCKSDAGAEVYATNNNFTQYAMISSFSTNADYRPVLELKNNNYSTYLTPVITLTGNRKLQLPDKDGILATEDYKVYTAILDITTSTPTATVLKNTLGVTISWSKFPSFGLVNATASGNIFPNKTFINQTLINNGGQPYFVIGSVGGVTTISYSFIMYDGTQTGLPNSAYIPIEIRVYPS
jgi:hypothetical protein